MSSQEVKSVSIFNSVIVGLYVGNKIYIQYKIYEQIYPMKNIYCTIKRAIWWNYTNFTGPMLVLLYIIKIVHDELNFQLFNLEK
jgi:hypothetical protein